MPLVTLLTDFGTRDYYVGAVRGVLRSRAPEASHADISHDVAPGDVEGGAFILGAAAPWFPSGTVHLAVVDPGVGGTRRILAVRGQEAFFVGPDNGLFERVLDGSVVRAVEESVLFNEGHGRTFHGRDRFAPVAAHLACGGDFDTLGPTVDDPVRLDLPEPRRAEGVLTGRVAHVDRFGNIVTDLPTAWLPDDAVKPEATIGSHATRRRVSHYEELEEGEAGLLPGSLGTLEMALAGDDLADRWNVSRGAVVNVRFG